MNREKNDKQDPAESAVWHFEFIFLLNRACRGFLGGVWVSVLVGVRLRVRVGVHRHVGVLGPAGRIVRFGSDLILAFGLGQFNLDTSF